MVDSLCGVLDILGLVVAAAPISCSVFCWRFLRSGAGMAQDRVYLFICLRIIFK